MSGRPIARPPSPPSPRLLTEAELELMNVLWRLGQGTVHEVLAALQEDPPPAYTTISTQLRILEQKQVVRSEKEGRGHRYIPLLSREDYQSTSLRHVLHRVFEDAPGTLVRRLLEETELSRQELDELKKLLDPERTG